MILHFNTHEDDFSLYLFLHNKDQMYMPKLNGVFGSDFMYLKVGKARMRDGNSTGIHAFYKMKQTLWKALDTPQKRCINNNKKANTTQCLTMYLEDKIGCSMGLARSDKNVERYEKNKICNYLQKHKNFFYRCNKTSQIFEYMQMNRVLFNADENKIFNLTGCLSKCEKYEYSMQPLGEMEYTSLSKNTLVLALNMPKAEHEIREQVNTLS